MCKTSLTVGILAVSSLISNNSLADGTTFTKASCTWGWKYQAKARATHGASGTVPINNKGCTCNGVPISASSLYQAHASQTCVYQNAVNACGTEAKDVAVTCDYWMSSRGGYQATDLDYALMQYTVATVADTAEQSNIKNNPVTFLSNQIKVNNVTGFLEAKPDMISSYEIKIWIPRHTSVEDTTIDASEIIWSGKVSLTNDQLLKEGGFTTETFSVINLTGKKRIVLNNKTFTINFASGVNLSNAVVISTTDGHYNNSGAALRLKTNVTNEATETGAVKFSIYPVPTSNLLTINFTPIKEGNTLIKLYSIDGKYITTLHNTTTKNGEAINTSIDVKALQLTAGKYVVLIDNEKEQFTKTIIVE